MYLLTCMLPIFNIVPTQIAPSAQSTAPEHHPQAEAVCSVDSKIVKHYQKEAHRGNAEAQVELGWFYQKGCGVKQDYAQALNWYRKAADQGNGNAQNRVGLFYENGWGVKQDNAEAMNWYRKAADRGDPEAQTKLWWLQEIRHLNWCLPEKSDPSCTTAPRVIYAPEPEYSTQARDAKYQGTCSLSVIVQADGLPSSIRILSSVGMGLDTKAVEAVSKWRFVPATRNGQPVSVPIVVEVTFHLPQNDPH